MHAHVCVRGRRSRAGVRSHTLTLMLVIARLTLPSVKVSPEAHSMPNRATMSPADCGRRQGEGQDRTAAAAVATASAEAAVEEGSCHMHG